MVSRAPGAANVAPAIVLLLACVGSAPAQVVASFDDIDYWVGEGDNRAALVIDWNEAAGQGGSLVWGYRWDGAATGRDMLLGVLADDQRLFAKLDAAEQRVFGLGYDAHDDPSFAISDGSPFDARGVTHATASEADLNTAVDPLDQYGEGWFLAFWHYAGRSDFESDWASNPQGFYARSLTDGDIDGWTLATVFNFTAFPDPPLPAQPPTTPGDFNLDGQVNAADYTVWRDTLGDPESYALWRTNYGAGVLKAPRESSAAPEPTAAALLAALAVYVWLSRIHLLRTPGVNS